MSPSKPKEKPSDRSEPDATGVELAEIELDKKEIDQELANLDSPKPQSKPNFHYNPTIYKDRVGVVVCPLCHEKLRTTGFGEPICPVNQQSDAKCLHFVKS